MYEKPLKRNKLIIINLIYQYLKITLQAPQQAQTLSSEFYMKRHNTFIISFQ